jgi:hypothetical protein
MSEGDTKYHTSDGSVLTPAECARLDEIESRLGQSDDVPETPKAAWASAIRGKHYPSMGGDTIRIRLDPDVQA